jgi:hypothetical protein
MLMMVIVEAYGDDTAVTMLEASGMASGSIWELSGSIWDSIREPSKCHPSAIQVPSKEPSGGIREPLQMPLP